MASPLANAPARRPIMARWVFVEIGTVAGAYLLTFGLAAACIYIPSEMATAGGDDMWGFILLMFGVVMAYVLLRSLVPRRERFNPPAPLLDQSKQPRLMRHVESIAQSLGQPVPEEIYLILEVNAWVAIRGGRRMMALGLPLMQALTVLNE